MVRAEAVHQVALQVEGLAAEAVEAAVFAEVDVAALVDPAEDLLDHLDVVRVGGADVAVVADVQVIPGLAEPGADAVHELLDRQAGLDRGFHHLVAVFIGAGLEAGLCAHEAMKPGQGVGHHGGIGMAQVGLGVDVIDGGGQVVGHSGQQLAVSS